MKSYWTGTCTEEKNAIKDIIGTIDKTKIWTIII